jgi:hypothetical protein
VKTKQQLRTQRLREAGLRPVQVWISKENQTAIDKVKSYCQKHTVRKVSKNET